MTQALAWRVEQACLNAWPALRSALDGDWMLRFGDGLSRRTNSVNPLHPRVTTIAADLDRFARLYDAHDLPLLVRLPSLLGPEVARELDARGFSAEGEVCTLFRTLTNGRFDADPDVMIDSSAGAEWLGAMARLQQQAPEHAATYARVIGTLALPAGFLTLRREGAVVATAYAVLHGDLVVVESVVVDEVLRGQGLGRRLMSALFAWAIDNGANAVCLQVVADNTAGRALYAGLGFDTELYRYHYRRAPVA